MANTISSHSMIKCSTKIQGNMKFTISLKAASTMYFTGLIRQFSLTGKQAQAKLSRCLGPIGTTILEAIKTHLGVMFQALWWVRCNRAAQTPSWVIRTSMVSSLAQLSTCSRVYKELQNKATIKVTRSTAPFCKFIMRNYMTYFKTETLQEPSTFVKISTQEFS